ncbi:MAG: hypothetical protein ACRD1Z_09550 [Vicinamibacteria bacterium]
MPEYVLVARRPLRSGVLVRGVKEALYIPAGMQGGLGAHAPGHERGRKRRKLTASELSSIQHAVQVLVQRGVPNAEARKIAIRVFFRMKGASASGLQEHGLGGIVSSTADFKRLSDVQNRAIAIQSEISGIGKDAWDSEILMQADSIERAGWSPASNFDYDKMMAFWLAQTKRLLVYGGAWVEHRPSNEDVADVDRLAGGTDRLIALVKSFIPPEAKAKAESDRAETERSLAKVVLQSPDDVAAATFKEEVLKRANTLFSGGIGILTIAAAAALALGLYMAFGRK